MTVRSRRSPRDTIRNILRKRTLPAAGAPFLKAGRGVWIYGAGNCGKDTLAVLTDHGIPVKGFLDAKIARGTCVNGVPVYRPDDEEIDPKQRRGDCVIIAIHNPDTDIVPIQNVLRKCRYGTVVNFPEFQNHFPDELGERFWLTSADYYDSLESPLAEGLTVWQDGESRALYEAVLEYRVTGNSGLLPPPRRGVQYFDRSVPGLTVPSRFVDGGSFDGDTLLTLRNGCGTIEKVAAFEPDPESFGRLRDVVRTTSPPFAREVTLFPCGLWSHNRQLKFSCGGTGASRLVPSGEIQVQCVALDDALHGFAPDFIKMDIEGAEYEALLGARETIRKYRPQLAVCLYHRPGHLWQIPLLIRQWALGYKFFLRMHCYSSFDLVMYAVA